MKRITVIMLLAFMALQVRAEFAPTYQKAYFWEFQGRRYNLKYSFDSEDYKHYKQTRRDYYDFSVYLKEAPGYPVIDAFAGKLKAMAAAAKLSPVETVEFVASFVQNFHYRDDGKYEYPRYPIETLVEQGGDCEDTAILLAAILRSMGYQSLLLSPTGHMGVGLAVKGAFDGMGIDYKGNKYYYIETTNTGWGLGDYPDHLSSSIKIYDPGYLAGSRPLAVEENSGIAVKSTTVQQKSESAEPPTTYEFQDDYISDRQLIGDEANGYTRDTMIIDGKTETVVTYSDGSQVRYAEH